MFPAAPRSTSSSAYGDGRQHGKEGAEMNPMGRSWEQEAWLCRGCCQVRLPSNLSENAASASRNPPLLPFSLKSGVGGLCSVPGSTEHWCVTPNYADLLPQLIFGGCTLPRGSSAGAASPTAMPPLPRKRQGSAAGAAKEVRGDRGVWVPGGVTHRSMRGTG